MKIKDIHEDVTRYLEEDCYCPYEVYGVDGFFCMIVKPDHDCEIVSQNERMTAIITKPERCKNKQIVFFWHDDEENKEKVIAAQRIDATENNIEIAKMIVAGDEPNGMKIDEFEKGSTKRAVEKVLSFSDAIIYD